MKRKYNINELKNSSDKKLYEEYKNISPGGTQLLSKRPELYAPLYWPCFYKKSKGFKVTDIDGRSFIDVGSMSVGAAILGYADDDVDLEVHKSIELGIVSTINNVKEYELSKTVLDIFKWASSVRYCKSGGEAVSIAIRAARAFTGKDKILFSGYHGWCDWYLAANIKSKSNLNSHLMSGLDAKGVPSSLVNSAIPFLPGDIDELNEINKHHKNEIAALIIEPARGVLYSKTYLNQLKEFCNKNKILLIFDEITTGFRASYGGLHLESGIDPDIAIVAKAVGNGYPIAMIVGNDCLKILQESFVSSTNWTDSLGFTAALSTIKKIKEKNVIPKIQELGKKFKEIWIDKAKENNIDIKIEGINSLPSFTFNYTNKTFLETIYTIEMLSYGYLAYKQVKPSYCHRKLNWDKYSNSVGNTFFAVKKYIETGILNYDIIEHHVGFKRLTN